MATAHQKEALGKLKPLGFEPIGYTNEGVLIVTHPVGYSIGLHSTPSDYKTIKNYVGEARRAIKRMQHAGPRFEIWLWEKYDIQPGQSKRLTISIPGEIKQFFRESGIERGASYDAVAQWYRHNGHLENTEPPKKGGGKRTWDISRPAEEEIVQEPEPELTVVEVAQNNGHVETETEEVHPPVVVVDSGDSQLDHHLIKRLEAAFNEPLQVELVERQERLDLVVGELEELDVHLRDSMEQTMKARERIIGLIKLLKG